MIVCVFGKMTERNGATPETLPRSFGVCLYQGVPSEELEFVSHKGVPNEATKEAKEDGERGGVAEWSGHSFEDVRSHHKLRRRGQDGGGSAGLPKSRSDRSGFVPRLRPIHSRLRRWPPARFPGILRNLDPEKSN